MKKLFKNIAMACVVLSSLLTVGCTDSFEEVNKDPDIAADVATEKLLGLVSTIVGLCWMSRVPSQGMWLR